MHTRLMLVCKVNRILFPRSKYQTVAFSSHSYGHGGVEDAMTQGVDTEGETNPHLNHNDNDNDDEEKKKEKEKEKEKEMINNNNNPMIMKMKDDMPLSSSKLQTPGVKAPFDPQHQQKRTKEDHHHEDDKHYFEHHKASPLSKIEILDSRKPLARVIDRTAGGDEPVITWRPEQLDTAEESLLRATHMFRDAATRGVPDWPHSKRLRQLRGEDW